MALLEIDNLTRRYPRQSRPAIEQVSLRAEPGELLALLGPSGSGKSTVLKCVAGIERPDEGAIRLDGADLLGVPAHRRSAVLMFQRAYLFPYLSVADNIGFALRVQRVPAAEIRSEVRRMLELVELPGYERRRPGELSGGEQQRVALARALVARPRLLLLDEPLSSLDPGVRQSLQEAIRGIQRELGLTTLLVTHDLSEALSMASRVAVLSAGRLAACETPQRLYERPPNRTAAAFVGASNILAGTVEGGRLHTAAGPLPLPAAGPARAGLFAIRPERLSLSAIEGPECLPARLIGAVYKGGHTEYQLEVGATTLVARSPQPLNGWRPGEQLFVRLPADDLFEIADA